MHIVSLVANARGTTERRIMHDYTPRQINHIGDAMMRDRTFVLNVISAALGGKSGGKITDKTDDLSGMRRKQATRAAGAVSHFDAAKPGGLTPGSRRYDLRGMTQRKAHEQLCAIMGQKPKES